MSRVHLMGRHITSAFSGLAMLAGVLTLSACVAQQVALPYQISVANQVTLSRLPRATHYRVTTGAEAVDVQTVVRVLRVAAPGNGSWSSYLGDAVRTELSTSGNYDAGANDSVEATLLEVHMLDGQAELAARFVVRRGQVVRYDKVLRVSTHWDSQFIGSLAMSTGLTQATAIFQDLLRKLFEDPDFINAT